MNELHTASESTVPQKGAVSWTTIGILLLLASLAVAAFIYTFRPAAPVQIMLNVFDDSHDRLVDMPSRPHFTEQLHNTLYRLKAGDTFTVFIASFGNSDAKYGLRAINDHYGISYGNKMRHAFATALRKFFPKSDYTFCNMGASRFFGFTTVPLTGEQILAKVNALHHEWHDKPFRLAPELPEFNGMIMFVTAQTFTAPVTDIRKIMNELQVAHTALFPASDCRYRITTADRKVLTNIPPTAPEP